MKINFDVISDLYLTDLNGIDWSSKASSLFCIVAGNISNDHQVLYGFLKHLSKFYQAVFFLDGDLEHDNFGGDFDKSYKSIEENIELLDDVFFLHENIIMLNGATILATNGWTTFNFTDQSKINDNIKFLNDQNLVPEDISHEIFKMAVTDQHYMHNSIKSCQTLDGCENIIIVTNSVPNPNFITHDKDYDKTILGDTSGNDGIIDCLESDTNNKISTWIFGKYPNDIDYVIDGVRFLNNPGSKKDLRVYYPKIIKF